MVDDIDIWAEGEHSGISLKRTDATTSGLPESASNKYGLLLLVNWNGMAVNTLWLRVFWFPTNANAVYVKSKTNNVPWTEWVKAV